MDTNLEKQLLFDQMDRRVALDKEVGDYDYFFSLSLKLEYLTKVVTCAVVACVGDDADRHRYSLEHKLVRADSLGEWVEVLNKALVGPAAQFLIRPPSNRAVTLRCPQG